MLKSILAAVFACSLFGVAHAQSNADGCSCPEAKEESSGWSVKGKAEGGIERGLPTLKVGVEGGYETKTTTTTESAGPHDNPHGINRAAKSDRWGPAGVTVVEKTPPARSSGSDGLWAPRHDPSFYDPRTVVGEPGEFTKGGRQPADTVQDKPQRDQP